MRNHRLSIAREYRNERGNTYTQNVLRRDLSSASWWYRFHKFTSSIHTSSIPRWKWLSLMRATNIIFPCKEYFMHQLCNSRILVGNLSINSGHIRGCPSTNGFLPAPSWTGTFSFPSSLASVSPVSATNSASASSSFERTLRSGTLCLGYSPSWGTWLYLRLLFFSHDFVIERS